MDAGLSGVECEAPGRIASNVGGNRLKGAFLSQNSLFLANFFLFGLIKTDRLLVRSAASARQYDAKRPVSKKSMLIAFAPNELRITAHSCLVPRNAFDNAAVESRTACWLTTAVCTI